MQTMYMFISLFASQRRVIQETSDIEIYILVGLVHDVLFKGSHRLEHFLKMEGFFERSLKIDFAIKMAENSLLSLEKYLKVESLL